LTAQSVSLVELLSSFPGHVLQPWLHRCDARPLPHEARWSVESLTRDVAVVSCFGQRCRE
jgi:hypothetical protein